MFLSATKSWNLRRKCVKNEFLLWSLSLFWGWTWCPLTLLGWCRAAPPGQWFSALCTCLCWCDSWCQIPSPPRPAKQPVLWTMKCRHLLYAARRAFSWSKLTHFSDCTVMRSFVLIDFPLWKAPAGLRKVALNKQCLKRKDVPISWWKACHGTHENIDTCLKVKER